MITPEQFAVVICIAVVLGTVLYVLGALLYGLWVDHEETQREAEQRRFLEVIHRTPAPFSQKAPQGFTRERKSFHE